MIVYYVLAICSTFMAAVGQVYLKQYSICEKGKGLRKIFHFYLILSVVFFLCSTFLSIYVLKKLSFTIFYTLTALNFVFIALLSAIVLKEKVDKTKVIGIVIIVLGLVIFNS